MNNTRYRNPYINLVSKTDDMESAWVFSRPYREDQTHTIEELEKMDLPLNGFKSYTFEISSSILFRDLLFTLRPINAWARSQRTLKFSTDNLFLSGEYRFHSKEESQAMMSEVYRQQSEGIPQDYIKKHLPLAISTEYTITIDDRTLVTYLKSLKEVLPAIYAVYGKKFLEAIGKTEEYITSRNTRSIFNKLAVLPEEEVTPTPPYDTEPVVAVLGTQVAISSVVTASLMAQFIRQHYSTVKNGLYTQLASIEESVRNSEDPHTDFWIESTKLTGATPVNVVVYADKESWENVVRARSQWFAQMDIEDNSSWSYLVGPYIKDMSPQEFVDFLGVTNGDDPYKRNMMGSIDLTEVNPPSPFLIEDPSIVDYRIKKMNSNSLIMKKWKEVADAGLINDNPENELRKTYESNIAKHGLPE